MALRETHSLLGKRYAMLVKDDFSCCALVYVLKHKSDAANAFRKFLADVRADGVPSKVEIVRFDNEGEFFGGEFGEVCKQCCIKQEFTNRQSEAERCCRESVSHHSECGTRGVHPSPYHLSSCSTTAH